jgi:DNA-binding SARP family transcriptional activator/class 3 adenylate cyclase
MEYGILGPLEVRREGLVVQLGGRKQRALLALLLLHANEVVSAERLIEELWAGAAPESAAKSLQVYVSRLRKRLGEHVVLTRAGGYVLELSDGELDLDRFRAALERGRRLFAAGDAGAASNAFRQGLALWRGLPLTDFRYDAFAQGEIAHLEELRAAAEEERLDAELALGRGAELVPELEALVERNPVRERPRTQLMLALYRAGRQAEALESFAAARRLLSDELGLEPGEELKQLQRAILAHDPSLLPAKTPGFLPTLAPSSADPPLGPTHAAREVRKTVTILHCDLRAVGRELDPEPLRQMTARGYEELLPPLERYGARTERSVGGAVTVIFGLPVVHEDDAMRAVHAAVEMRDGLARLAAELERRFGARLELRAGIATGEVVARGDDHVPDATGAAVDRAVHLQQEAARGEILLSEQTLRLVGDVVEAEPRGRHARLLALLAPDLRLRDRFDAPMVGRERERRRLDAAFEQAVADRSCQLFTVLGAPGVGKSRLVREFVTGVAEQALVAGGRCLPYGEGITYWPVIEVVRELAGLDDSESAEASLAKLFALLAEEERGELVAQGLSAMIGLTEELTSAEESLWAVRTLFEALARRQPLVVVFDDIHWGEPTFLDLVDHVSDWTQDVRLMLVCIARPELLDTRPGWGGGKLNSTSILLESLSPDESLLLLDNLSASKALDEAARQRIVDAADGNPLFVEEMLALLLDDEDAATRAEVPPTIQALLAARLDRLPPEERTAMEAASVEGKIFHEASVAELLGASPSAVRESLVALVRKDLVRPEGSVFSDERAFRFRHLLIRDAAYEALPKQARAMLHERHAQWLERKAGERTLEFEEILGYHLERAFRYRAEVGSVDEEAQETAVRAGRRLAVAGRRAVARGDGPAAINLLSRAAALLPADEPQRVHLIPGLREIQGLGDELRWAKAVLDDAIVGGDRSLRTHALVQRSLLRLFTEAEIEPEPLVETATRGIETFEELEDDLGLARAWRLLQQARYLARDGAGSADAAEHALRYARRADDPLEELEVTAWMGIALFLGGTPVAEATRRVEAHLAHGIGGRAVATGLRACLAGLSAMSGNIVEARASIARARSVVDDLGFLTQTLVPFYEAVVEQLAGEPAGAERVLRSRLRPLEEAGETSTYSSIVALLAQAVYAQGRYDEAEELARISEETSHLNDVHAQATWQPVRAKVLARRGRFDEAERLARDAVAFAAESDFLNAHGDALVDLSVVLDLAGRPQEGAPAVEEAILLFEQKENAVSVARARRRLQQLRAR